MNITFCINYLTEWGQSLCIVSDDNILQWTDNKPLLMQCHGTDYWTVTIPVPDFLNKITYRYAVLSANGNMLYEAGKSRTVALLATDRNVLMHDFWQVDDYEKVFHSIAFTQSLFRRKNCIKDLQQPDNVRFSIDLPQILPTQGVAIIGSTDGLGQWDISHKLVLSDEHFPLWTGSVKADPNQTIEYKYIIYDLNSGDAIDIESGANRQVWGLQNQATVIQNDRCFRRTKPQWKGAGVAIPVFSLRTENSYGIGEFLDLKLLVDWAALTGQKLIQTLPVNDTTLLHTNQDSYPYNAVSVFALHPIYLNIENMGQLTPALQKKYLAEKTVFNQKKFADYQVVYNGKMKYFKAIYKAEKDTLFSSHEFKLFFKNNKEWLVPYAVFCYLRDKYGTPHFSRWKQYAVYQPKDVERLSQPSAKEYDKVAFYYFLQFHLDKQLSQAVNYAHTKGIVLKGDIPIGISPDSVDAWTNPKLFNLNASAGAPPDAFSIKGQNWGFPTYNWDRMEKDNYCWWRQRLCKMANYFDAYRIDHILGFFRIWQMPKTAVWGLLGHFSPAIPYTMQDLWNMGVTLDEDRLTKPYIRSNYLNDIFGQNTEYAKRKFLNTNDGYIYWLKDEFNTQQKVQQYFEQNNLTDEFSTKLRDALLYLHCEVLFVRDMENPNALHPRITLCNSYSYRELKDEQKKILADIHNDYFYYRHNTFWYQSAIKKLPSLINATDMLVCGEDLGMVPACVPEVMHKLNILSLEIQRMPKNPNMAFAHPADAPYLSVCTTGTHDMNPIRAWWEENQKTTQQFYNEQMGWNGEAPKVMSGKIAEFIVNQHIYSHAIWVILPLQDWMAINEDVRCKDAHAERINIPDNPHHFWCYRMHITIEDLLKKNDFNQQVKELVTKRLQ